MKLRSVVFAPEAQADLSDLYDWIADAATPATALGYVERIEAFCARLSAGSLRGHLRDDIRPGLRIIGFERRVTVAFVVEPETVVILRLLYAGRTPEGGGP